MAKYGGLVMLAFFIYFFHLYIYLLCTLLLSYTFGRVNKLIMSHYADLVQKDYKILKSSPR